MRIDWGLVAAILVPLIAAFLAAAAARWWERRPRLICYLAHATGCRITPDEGEPFFVNVHSIVLRNDGSRAASNVRVGHTGIRFNYHVEPDFEYAEIALPGGGKEIAFATFPPKRQVTITYLCVGATWEQINTHLESDEGPVEVQNVLPTRQFSKATNRFLAFLLICGAVSVLYASWTLFRALWVSLAPFLTAAT